ncbi:MAG: Glycosyltransferase AglE [Methanoregula sp. PtaU1.Bin051]|nr:MAG: Glycosyltransferase AglE [Methanoregula sp. PtaU1.Bin051]
MVWQAGIVVIILASIPYLFYFLGIRFGKKTPSIPVMKNPPPVSIVISAYNEARIIAERIENIASLRYPHDRIEVILVDDCSSDDTGSLAAAAFGRTDLSYRIIRNDNRLGTNRSYNRAIATIENTIVVTTDADVFFTPDTLGILISRLCSDDRIAAACADLRPHDSRNSTADFESVYRNFYGQMCDWESAIDSTYTLNGAMVAFRKDLVQRIEESRGADDANTAFAAIRNGYRAVYEIHAVVYEILPEDLPTQFRQKTRRAKRLIEATLANLNLLFLKRPFALFYAMRIWMYTFTPVLYIMGTILFMAGIFLVNIPVFALLLIAGLFLFFVWKRNLVSAFTINQIYLFSGLLNLGKNTLTWESTSKK